MQCACDRYELQDRLVLVSDEKQVSVEIERIQISLEQTDSLNWRFTVRQIAGLLARRIVCKIRT